VIRITTPGDRQLYSAKLGMCTREYLGEIMGSRLWTHAVPGAALTLAAVLAGCSNDRNRTANMADSAASTGMAADTTAMASPNDTGSMSAASTKLSDANIVYLLDEANKADSSAGALAATKATSADVKQFAKLMMGEHHGLRMAGQQLAKKLNVTPEAPANDPVASMAQQEMSTLQSTPKGAEFDRTYINQEVTAHKAVKDLLDQSEDAAQNQQLKDLIEKAKPVIDKHLEKAEAIQKKLSPSA
jgi:putative membrane protein